MSNWDEDILSSTFTANNTVYQTSCNTNNSWITHPYVTITVPIAAPSGTYTINDKFDSDISVRGDIILNGKSLSDRLAAIEERLEILHTNITLEEKWKELKKIGKQYRALESALLEKEKVWSILKK